MSKKRQKSGESARRAVYFGHSGRKKGTYVQKEAVIKWKAHEEPAILDITGNSGITGGKERTA